MPRGIVHQTNFPAPVDPEAEGKAMKERLEVLAHPGCRKCFGRGWTGQTHDKAKLPIPCRCTGMTLTKKEQEK